MAFSRGSHRHRSVETYGDPTLDLYGFQSCVPTDGRVSGDRLKCHLFSDRRILRPSGEFAPEAQFCVAATAARRSTPSCTSRRILNPCGWLLTSSATWSSPPSRADLLCSRTAGGICVGLNSLISSSILEIPTRIEISGARVEGEAAAVEATVYRGHALHGNQRIAPERRKWPNRRSPHHVRAGSDPKYFCVSSSDGSGSVDGMHFALADLGRRSA